MVEAKFEMKVGETLEEFLQDAANTWDAAAKGEQVKPSHRVVFHDWTALASVLTPARMKVLATLHAQPADSVRALSRALARDVKHVHGDVVALENAGLIERDEQGGLSVPFDEVQSVISMRKMAAQVLGEREKTAQPSRPKRAVMIGAKKAPSGVDM